VAISPVEDQYCDLELWNIYLGNPYLVFSWINLDHKTRNVDHWQPPRGTLRALGKSATGYCFEYLGQSFIGARLPHLSCL
jgi:hypothetical protein